MQGVRNVGFYETNQFMAHRATNKSINGRVE